MCLANYCVLVLALAVRAVISDTHAVENWPWWRHASEPRLQRVAAGLRAELRCAGRLDAAAVWDYLPCGGADRPSCQAATSSERDWSRLPLTSSVAVLSDVTTDDSGLYRCREAATRAINVYSTLQLEVLEYATDEDTRLPEFLNGLPKNMTVTAESQVIMQCKVTSRTRPTIVWLAQGRGPITYKDHSYSLLNSSGEMALPGGVYLSKMVISEARLSHEGWYYCLAINTKGFTNHSAYLTVLPSKLDRQRGYSSLYWLFLMPLPLAIIPVLVWTVYWCNKSRSNVKCNVNGVQVEMVHLRQRNARESEII